MIEIPPPQMRLYWQKTKNQEITGENILDVPVIGKWVAAFFEDDWSILADELSQTIEVSLGRILRTKS